VAGSQFSVDALHAALDRRREALGITWTELARQITEMSHELNGRRRDHPISPSTLREMPRRTNTSCQHALLTLRWLDRSPESFDPLARGTERDRPLPAAGPDRRLRWDLRALHRTLDSRRRDRGMTWRELASELDCSASQLTALRAAKYATGMALAMRITAWLELPAAQFIVAARW
jgi:transcriptional regulator with XRE-family HTH domain